VTKRESSGREESRESRVFEAAPAVAGACPIPTTHRRLNDSHRLWHQTLDVYDDPDAFRANLNSAVQAFRSVTNMLQKEKRQVPGFAEWYEAWREKMKADPVLLWVDAARTRVFHKGDLEVHSTAQIRIRDEWAPASVLATDEVSPFDSTESIARALAAGFIEGFVETYHAEPPEFLILEVERRWVDRELPEWELLDALAYAYGVIATIVREAHERAGARFEPSDMTHGETRLIQVPYLGGRLPCMVAATEERTATVKLRTGEIVRRTYKPLPSIDSEEAAERYRLRGIEKAASSDPFDMAPVYMEIARRALLVDGEVIPVTFLFGPNGREQIAHPAGDRAEKFLVWDFIARRVEASGATAVVSVGEAWLYRVPENELEAMIMRPRREEGLGVTAATQDGRYRMWSMRFRRSPAGRMLPEPITVTDLEEPPNFMRAVIDVWARWGRADASTRVPQGGDAAGS
jgi:hypothetical protein